MSKRKITDEEVALINTKQGLHALLRSKETNLNKVIEELEKESHETEH